MTQKTDALRLESLLTRCENLFLELPDRDVVEDPDVDATLAFITGKLANRSANDIRSSNPMPADDRLAGEVSSRSSAVSRLSASRPVRPFSARMPSQDDTVGRRLLLGRLIAGQSNIPARITAAFQNHETADEDISRMLDELVRKLDAPSEE
jgi:hypothetical protein